MDEWLSVGDDAFEIKMFIMPVSSCWALGLLPRGTVAPKTPQPPLFLFFIDFAFILGSQKGVAAVGPPARPSAV
jgi:hypothetical protein